MIEDKTGGLDWEPYEAGVAACWPSVRRHVP